MHHLSINVLVVSANNELGKISELCRTYSGGAGAPKAARSRSRTKSSTLSQPSDDPYLQFERAYTEARGQAYCLSNTRPVHLRDHLRRAEELLTQVRPVALQCNTYAHHVAVQVVLRNCAVISYVFDPASSDLARVYLDQSAQAHTQALCSAAVVAPDRLVLGMDERRVVAFVNANRDKAKRPYAPARHAVCRTAESSERRPAALGFNATGRLMVAAHTRRVCLFRWDDQQVEPAFPLPSRRPSPSSRRSALQPMQPVVKLHPKAQAYTTLTGAVPAAFPGKPGQAFPTAMTPAKRSAGAKDKDTSVTFVAELVLDKCRIVFCRFHQSDHSDHRSDQSDPGTLLLVYEEEEKDDVAQVRVCRARYDSLRGGLEMGPPLYGFATGKASLESSLRVTVVETSPQDSRLVLGCKNGTLIMLSMGPLGVVEEQKRVQAENSEPLLMLWHSTGALLLVFFANGHVCVFDCALQRLSLVGEKGLPTRSLDLSQYIFSAKVTHAVWAAHSQAGLEGADSEKREQRVAVMFDRGPLVMIEIHTGVRPGASLRARDVLSQRLRNREIPESVEMVAFVDDAHERYICLSLLLSALFRLAGHEEELQAVFARYWPEYAKVDEEHHEAIAQLYIRLLHRLLALQKLEEAFLVAKQIDRPACYEDLYAWALQNQRKALADVVFPLTERPGLVRERTRAELTSPRLVKALTPRTSVPFAAATTTITDAVASAHADGSPASTVNAKALQAHALPAGGSAALPSAARQAHEALARGVALETSGRLAEAVAHYARYPELRQSHARASRVLALLSESTDMSPR